MVKRIVLIVSIFVVVGLCYAISLYNKKPVDTSVADADITVEAIQLINEFNKNQEEATIKYKKKVSEIDGKITSFIGDNKAVVINGLIRCEMDKSFTEGMNVGDLIKIKGVFGGFDDLFEEVLFIRCNVVK